MKKTINKQKLAQERSYNRKYNVNNNCVPPVVKNPYKTVDKEGNIHIEWKKLKVTIPKGLTHTSRYDKIDGKKVKIPSEQGEFHKKYTVKGIVKNSKEYIEAYAKYKLAKWEKKNPCPIKLDGIQQDMFETEFLIPWKEKRKEAEKKAYTYAVRVYGQFSLVGRFKINQEDKYEEHTIGKLRDVDGSTAKYGGINHCSEKVPIIQAATIIANTTKAKTKTLVSIVIKDSYNKQGRIILPKLSAAA